MSTKPHCDLCDEVITFDVGTVDYTRSQTLDGAHHMDLCPSHYNSFYQVVLAWKKFEQGYVVTWPTDRTNS